MPGCGCSSRPHRRSGYAPILAELIKERGVVVLYILEILEHDILVVVENIKIIVLILIAREDIGQSV